MTRIFSTFKQIGFFTIALTLALAANFAYGEWVNPASPPPDGNIAAPINTSAQYQEKYGTLGLGQLVAVDKVRSDLYCDLLGSVCLTSADIQALKIMITAPTPTPTPSNLLLQLSGTQGALVTKQSVLEGGTIDTIVVPSGVTHAIISSTYSHTKTVPERIYKVSPGDSIVYYNYRDNGTATFINGSKWTYSINRAGTDRSTGPTVSGLNIVYAAGGAAVAASSRTGSTDTYESITGSMWWAKIQ